jgi:hypothetical protein
MIIERKNIPALMLNFEAFLIIHVLNQNYSQYNVLKINISLQELRQRDPIIHLLQKLMNQYQINCSEDILILMDKNQI